MPIPAVMERADGDEAKKAVAEAAAGFEAGFKKSGFLSSGISAEGNMGWLGRLASIAKGGGWSRQPVGVVHVVDPSPLNWLYITYNTVEEPVRVAPSGVSQPAAMKGYRWRDDRTLEIDVRRGLRFPDGEPLTASTVKRGFDEMMRWKAPHPPGTHFNLHPKAHCEVMGEHAVRLHLPEPDGLALGKLRAMHIMSTRFWNEVGFGYVRDNSGEGHW